VTFNHCCKAPTNNCDYSIKKFGHHYIFVVVSLFSIPYKASYTTGIIETSVDLKLDFFIGFASRRKFSDES
jgi:hypothetical protein